MFLLILSTEIKTPFLYGEQDFLQFSQGSFFRDNTHFIAKMEDLETRAITALHPRRFGKSLFISMLNTYYDIKNKDRVKELFKGYWIGENLTPDAASFLVLPLDFSGLDVNSYERFEQSFNVKNNSNLKKFLKKYKEEFGDILQFNRESDFVNNLKEVCDIMDLQGLKVYSLYCLSYSNSLSSCM
jgi:hypothetical protein